MVDEWTVPLKKLFSNYSKYINYILIKNMKKKMFFKEIKQNICKHFNNFLIFLMQTRGQASNGIHEHYADKSVSELVGRG